MMHSAFCALYAKIISNVGTITFAMHATYHIILYIVNIALTYALCFFIVILLGACG